MLKGKQARTLRVATVILISWISGGLTWVLVQRTHSLDGVDAIECHALHAESYFTRDSNKPTTVFITASKEASSSISYYTAFP